MRFLIRNHTANPAYLRVLIRLKTSSGQSAIEKNKPYDGKRVWHITPFFDLDGWFDLIQLINDAQIGKAANTWPDHPMTINLQVDIYDVYGDYLNTERQEFTVEIDGILSASIDVIDEITLVTTKSPESLGKKLDKRTVVFEGNAIEAVKKFPMNINVAGSLSLAGMGFDKTKVEIVADPVVTRISHKILAHGRFGRLRAEVENMPNPNNPKSSYMASLSAIATLKKIINPIQIGA